MKTISYKEKLAGKKALEEKVESLKADVQAASNDRFWKRRAREEAENTVKGNKHPSTDYEKKRGEQYKGALVNAEKEEDAAEENYKRLNAELTSLQEELRALRLDFDVDDVLAFQEEKVAAEKEVANLRSLVEKQQSIIEEANASVPVFPDRKEARENLLVDIATDRATEADLKKLDSQIKKEEEAVSKALAKIKGPVEEAQQTLSGLRRRLEDAEGRSELLRDQRGEILFHFLMTRAEQVGKEYADLARNLIEKGKMILALESLMYNTDFVPPQFVNPARFGLLRDNESSGLQIPIYRLNAHENLGKIDTDDFSSSLEKEKKNISALGVDLTNGN